MKIKQTAGRDTHKHWHGAASDSWFSHIAVECSGVNTSNEWLEPVTDEQYDNL